MLYSHEVLPCWVLTVASIRVHGSGQLVGTDMFNGNLQISSIACVCARLITTASANLLGGFVVRNDSTILLSAFGSWTNEAKPVRLPSATPPTVLMIISAKVVPWVVEPNCVVGANILIKK